MRKCTYAVSDPTSRWQAAVKYKNWRIFERRTLYATKTTSAIAQLCIPFVVPVLGKRSTKGRKERAHTIRGLQRSVCYIIATAAIRK